MRLIAGFLLLAWVIAAWASASRLERESVRLAPDPASTPDAVIQVYGARALGLKGLFGVHTWVAVKATAAGTYTVYEVIGWRLRRGASPVVVRQRVPDAPWFGAEPELIAEKRGAGVEEMIGRIERAARGYPWADEYRLWPGPNSNSFTAWLLRAVPELHADLPATAIGKDYSDRVLGTAPSGSGLQLSLAGLLGVTFSGVEGMEINILGLSFGLNPFDLSVKLPLIGRFGPPRGPFHEPVSAPQPSTTGE